MKFSQNNFKNSFTDVMEPQEKLKRAFDIGPFFAQFHIGNHFKLEE